MFLQRRKITGIYVWKETYINDTIVKADYK